MTAPKTAKARELREEYRGFEVVVTRERSLGGDMHIYHHAVRQSDQLVILDGFSEGRDSIHWTADWLKREIDAALDNGDPAGHLED